MSKFKCKLSGTVVEFLSEHDIETMRQHPDYEEVVEEEEDKLPKRIKKEK
jgi:hypothetical protein